MKPWKFNMDEERSYYYQQIARHFFALRGAPFFLSAADLLLISHWEEMRIPLTCVLEGIEEAFARHRQKVSPRRKVYSLAFCQPQVLKVFAQFREKKVGVSRHGKPRKDKAAKISLEINKFLSSLPREMAFLKAFFEEAQNVLSQENDQEEKLEALEAEVERTLLAQCPDEDKEKVEGEVREEFKTQGREELECLFEIKLIKHLRQKYRIPYISFLYY